jgi:hypothetical protein
MDLNKMSEVGGEILNKIAQVEELGQLIVGTQSSVIQMDQQRAKLREALHAVNRSSENKESSLINTAVCPDLFIQYPSTFLQKVIKDDVKKLDSLIDEHREEIKRNVNKLRQLEGDKDLTELGFDLKSYQDRITDTCLK